MPSFLEKAIAKKIARGTYKAMSVSAIAMRNKFPEMKYHSDYAKLALEQRPKWHRVDNDTFSFNEDSKISIKPEDSIMDVIEKIYSTEMMFSYFRDIPTSERVELIGIGLEKLKKYV